MALQFGLEDLNRVKMKWYRREKKKSATPSQRTYTVHETTPRAKFVSFLSTKREVPSTRRCPRTDNPTCDLGKKNAVDNCLRHVGFLFVCLFVCLFVSSQTCVKTMFVCHFSEVSQIVAFANAMGIPKAILQVLSDILNTPAVKEVSLELFFHVDKLPVSLILAKSNITARLCFFLNAKLTEMRLKYLIDEKKKKNQNTQEVKIKRTLFNQD